MPSRRPLSCGSTSPTADAAPVVVGMIDSAAARARRRSLCGRSSSCWSFVYEWTVVIQPLLMPNDSCSTFATGARQFVVHDAFEMMWWVPGVVLVLVHAEDDRQVRALRRRGDHDLLRARLPDAWPRASRLVKRPVDSNTTSTPSDFHGSCAGSLTDSTWNSSPSTVIRSPVGRDVRLQVAQNRVVLEQVGERLRVGQVVDGDNIDRVVIHRRAHDVPANPAEPVDPYFDGHSQVSPSTDNCPGSRRRV